MSLPAGIDSFLVGAGWAGAEIEPLAGDASFRRYFRIRRGEKTAMLMDAPPPNEDPAPFLRAAKWLDANGMRAPYILAEDARRGLVLLEDFGEASLTADNGASGYYRVDWFTPDGLRNWGDGRILILGTKGYIELRKYIELSAENPEGDQLYLVDEKGEHRISCAGKSGYPFFGQLILDCLNRTEHAMTQAHAFKAAELCLLAQARAVRLG